jgi:hypothetical protein
MDLHRRGLGPGRTRQHDGQAAKQPAAAQNHSLVSINSAASFYNGIAPFGIGVGS